MQHECKITIIDKKCFTDYQEQYLADPKSGPCPFFNVGDKFILKRTPQQDDFYHHGEGYTGIGKDFLDMENMLVLADDEGIFGSSIKAPKLPSSVVREPCFMLRCRL